MTRLSVDLDALAELVELMQRFDEHLALVRDDADRRVAALHTAWSGESAQLQQAAHQQWSTAADQVQDALSALRVIGRTAHSNYTAAVTANRVMWRW